MKEPNPQNNSKIPDKNKILSPNEKLKEMQAFINSLQSKKRSTNTNKREIKETMKKIINIVDFMNKKEFNELINILPILENHFEKIDPENYEYEDNHLAIKFRLEDIAQLSLHFNLTIDSKYLTISTQD